MASLIQEENCMFKPLIGLAMTFPFRFKLLKGVVRTFTAFTLDLDIALFLVVLHSSYFSRKISLRILRACAGWDGTGCSNGSIVG
ncbi:hypothetical protein C7G42_14715 [Bradyrhizobium sp. MOS003]|nr:hypothetical protein C7G42_14715 [Bradyrhizobium sp. MOS003]